jgi:hypothetical protein
MKLTTHQLVPRSRKHKSIHPLHHMFSLRIAYLVEHRANFSLLLTVKFIHGGMHIGNQLTESRSSYCSFDGIPNTITYFLNGSSSPFRAQALIRFRNFTQTVYWDG